MPVDKAIELGKSGVHAGHMVLRDVTIIADDPSNLRLIGRYMAYEDAAAKASGSGPIPGLRPEVEVKNADLSPSVLAALATVVQALEEAAVADAGVTEVPKVVAVEAVAAIAADVDAGIPARAAVAAVAGVKFVPGVPAGPLNGGTVV